MNDSKAKSQGPDFKDINNKEKQNKVNQHRYPKAKQVEWKL